MFLMTETGRVIGQKHGFGFAQLDFTPENGPFFCRFDRAPGQIVNGAFAGSILERHVDGRFSVKTSGSYMCAAPAWNVVEFNRAVAGEWETFYAIEEDALLPTSDGEGAVATADILWGKCRLYETDPSLLEVRDCFYLPWSPSETWGVFAADGSCLFDAMTERHAYSAPLETPLCLDEVKASAPETTYIYGGLFNCHFGHFIVDTLSRLWNSNARGCHKILFHSEEEALRWFERPFVRDVLSVLNIGPNDVTTFREPRRISRLIIPKTSLSAQSYVHRIYGDFCRSLGEKLGATCRKDTSDRPVYFSRSRLKIGTGVIINEVEMESHLANHGVAIVYPEELTFNEQVRRMQEASYIMSLAGSVLHLSAFCSPKRIVGLSTNRAVNSNFRLIDAATGSNASYWYPTGIQSEDPSFGFQSAYRLDDPKGVARALMVAATA